MATETVLTKDQVLSFAAGLELDKLVAERVMGTDCAAPRRYSRDDCESLRVVRHMRGQRAHPGFIANDYSNWPDHPKPIGPGHSVEFQSMEDGRWFACFTRLHGAERSPDDGFGHGETFALAVCRAALLTTIPWAAHEEPNP